MKSPVLLIKMQQIITPIFQESSPKVFMKFKLFVFLSSIIKFVNSSNEISPSEFSSASFINYSHIS